MSSSLVNTSTSSPPSGTQVPPSLREIARAANVSVATISMALRNHPRVSVATRGRIQALARELGYQQNPEVTRLMDYLRRNRSAKRMESLGFVTRLSPEELVKQTPFFREFQGAQARAAELGYRLEHYTVDEDMTEARLGRVLRNRGVRGIVIGPQMEPGGRLELQWEHFACVAIGYSCLWPETSRVINDKMQSVHLALGELRRLGYRRPALVMEQWTDDRLRNHWLGGFLSCQFRYLPKSAHIPPMMEPSNRKRMLTWYKRWKPDVLLGVELAESLSFLRENAGVEVPGDLAFAVLDKQTEGRWAHHAGIDQMVRNIGITAVDILGGYLMRNEMGLPAHPQVVSLPGVWVDGETAPPRSGER